MKLTVKGVRTNCRTKEKREVDVEFKIWYGRDKTLKLEVLNGVTGHECWIVDDYFMDNIEKGLCVCAGCDRWDSLDISGKEMVPIIEGLKVILKD